jgi:hypothetical protein
MNPVCLCRSSSSPGERQTQLTSIEAFHQELDNGNICKSRQRVLEIIARVHPTKLTDSEIAYFYMASKDPNVVRPRRNELVKLGKVASYGTKICGVTGKRALVWGLT